MRPWGVPSIRASIDRSMCLQLGPSCLLKWWDLNARSMLLKHGFFRGSSLTRRAFWLGLLQRVSYISAYIIINVDTIRRNAAGCSCS